MTKLDLFNYKTKYQFKLLIDIKNENIDLNLGFYKCQLTGYCKFAQI